MDSIGLNSPVYSVPETDIVIVEGFKNENHPKIEVIDEKANKHLFQDIRNIKAIISNVRLNTDLKQFKKNEIEKIVKYILNEI